MTIRTAHPRHRHASSRAFTMVELLIVVGIISLLFSTAFGLRARVRDYADTSEARLIAQQHGTLLAKQWREDIALASDAEIVDDGHAMRIVRFAPDGFDRIVRYELDEKKRITRRESSDLAPTVVKPVVGEVVSLEFEKTGVHGYRSRWRTEDNNGIRIIQWTHEAFAAPLR